MRFCQVSEGVSPSIKTLVKSIESDGKSSFDRTVDGESQTLIYWVFFYSPSFFSPWFIIMCTM